MFWCRNARLLQRLRAAQDHAGPANPLFGSDYAFTEVYLLAAAAEGGRSTFEGTEKAVRGWVDCFPRRALAGTVFAGGVSGVGEIAGHPALEQARRMGMEI